MDPTKLTTVVMLVSLMLNAGLQCDRPRLMAVLKDYGLVGRALLANFVIVPLVAVVVVRLFNLDSYIATGVLLMAIAPGAPFLPQAAGRQAGGSLGLAIALAFILPLISVVTIPITAQLVFPSSIAAEVPASQFVSTLLLFQLLPLIIGMLFAIPFPEIARKLERPLVIIFFLSVFTLLAILSKPLVQAVGLVYGSGGMWATLIIVVISLATGWALSGNEAKYRRTLSIGTVLRNIGLCALIATSNFKGTAVTAAVLTYFLIQVIVSTIYRVVATRSAAATGG